MNATDQIRQIETTVRTIKARNDAARREAIAAIKGYRSATLGRTVTIPED
jgi:hypothetical protein